MTKKIGVEGCVIVKNILTVAVRSIKIVHNLPVRSIVVKQNNSMMAEIYKSGAPDLYSMQ